MPFTIYNYLVKSYKDDYYDYDKKDKDNFSSTFIPRNFKNYVGEVVFQHKMWFLLALALSYIVSLYSLINLVIFYYGFNINSLWDIFFTQSRHSI
jgi:hypothetical protein